MYIVVINDGGFTFGMDAVTPQTFIFTRQKRTRGIYRRWWLDMNAALNRWVNSLPNKEYHGTYQQLQREVAARRSETT